MISTLEIIAPDFPAESISAIVALHEAHPMFVILSPNNAAIKAGLKQLADGQSLPGVRHWKEAKTVVRI